MKKTLKDIKVSDSVKNITKITSGTLLGQIISMVAVPIYTRMYGPTVLGIYAIFLSISTIVTSFSDFGLKNAIMIEKGEENTEKLYTIITTITAIISIITGIIVFVYYEYISKSLGLNSMVVAVIVTLIAFLTPQAQTCYTWLNKKGKYNVLMKNPLINNSVTAIATILLGIMGLKTYGYYLGTIIGSTVTLIHMKCHLPKKMFNFKLEDYKYVIKTKKEFYFYQMPTNILAQFKEQVPVFMINMFYGKEVLGFYSITMKYLKLPIGLVAQSIGRVFLKNVSDMGRRGESIGEYAFKNVCRAMKFATVPLICIYSIGDIACQILFGKEYIVAGTIMRIVASNSFFMFLLVSCQGMTVVLRKQKNSMIASIAHMIGYAGGIALGYYLTHNLYISFLIMTIFYAIIQTVFFSSLFEAAGVKWTRYVFSMLKYMAIIAVGSIFMRFVLCFIGLAHTI